MGRAQSHGEHCSALSASTTFLTGWSEVAEEQGALRPWARKGGDKKRKTGGVLREKEELFFSSNMFDGGTRKKFTRHSYCRIIPHRQVSSSLSHGAMILLGRACPDLKRTAHSSRALVGIPSAAASGGVGEGGKRARKDRDGALDDSLPTWERRKIPGPEA